MNQRTGRILLPQKDIECWAKLQGGRWLRIQRGTKRGRGLVGLGVEIEVFASLALQKGGGGPSRLGQADLDGQVSQQARKMRRKCRRSASSLLRPALSLKATWAAGTKQLEYGVSLYGVGLMTVGLHSQ